MAAAPQAQAGFQQIESRKSIKASTSGLSFQRLWCVSDISGRGHLEQDVSAVR